MVPEYTTKLVRQRVVSRQSITYTGPRSILPLLKRYMAGADRERQVVVLLNHKQQVVGITTTAIGTRMRVDACLRDIIKPVLLCEAYSFVTVHNHPSGDPAPSKADRESYKAIKDVALSMLVPLEDSIILGANNFYFSFAEEELRQCRSSIKERRSRLIAKAERRLQRGTGSPRDVCLVAAERLEKSVSVAREEAIDLIEKTIVELRAVIDHPARIRRVVRKRARELYATAVGVLADLEEGRFPSLAELAKVLPWAEPETPPAPDLCVELDFWRPPERIKKKRTSNLT
jgi:hypothetical protein